ncbi:A24 family peptidase [Paenibacillus sp.]|uniref:prepilin peptidase n=1 Tax=Paenibacillus sp. TaxID=58172 RepID=UPI0028117449|nr:A24 family peptidase [Paenibacillus sp.]
MQEFWFAAALAFAGVPLGLAAEAWAARSIRRKAPVAARSRRRWPAAAAASGACGWAGWRYGFGDAEWIAAVLLVFVLVAVTITDLRAMLIPNAIVLPAAGVAMLFRVLWHPLPLWHYAAGAAVGFGLLYALSALSKGGIGGGDVKLYLFVGLVCGLQDTLLSLLLASFAGAAFGVAGLLNGRRTGRRTGPIPFGPFIAGGAIAAMSNGESWMRLILL